MKLSPSSPTAALTSQQIADYSADGFLIIRDLLAATETEDLRHVVQQQAQCNAYFDADYGPFLVSPESHKLTRPIGGQSRIRDLCPPDADQLPPFIDPELKASDLLLVNEHTICHAVETWKREDITRGKGVAIHQSKQQFDS